MDKGIPNRRRRQHRITKSMEEPSKNSKIAAFTSSEIVEITSNFKTMIGKGGFGEVYLGTLKDGIDVAVKVLLSSLEQCHKTFLAEAKLLTVVHHKNLVSLVGYCDEDGKEALIYDYMPNGNLKQHLSEKSKTTLIWIERLQVALDVACGLEYLHGRKPPIVHRDLKPDNILFNEYMQAKIADFGLSKAFATESASYISTRPAGTPGYIDPESWNIGRISKRSDVYSFGIILLELVTEMNSEVLDETGRTNVLVRIYKNIRGKGAIMKSMEERERPMSLRNIRIFTYTEVAKITSNFKKVIGEGGFGKVYLGTLHDDAHVAVKVLPRFSKEGYNQFRTEVKLLSHFYHRNVVSLVGYCDEDGKKALIYEYMSKGNLEEHLSGKCERILSWNERLQIAIDIAYGLEYVQMCCELFIVHRNLKAPNILLTENMRGKISNFGLAACFYEEFEEVDYVCGGTIGYMAPECLRSREINKKTDLHSFGIILLEMLTGRPAFALKDHPCPSIVDQLRPIMEAGDIQRIVDPRLQGKFNINIALRVAKLAMSCASATANHGPDLSHVLVELKECLALEMPSQQTEEIQIDREESQNSDEVHVWCNLLEELFEPRKTSSPKHPPSEA
ncbi:hypothetical protein SLEP1_g27154 [Rubroshorea leprosula]|uniref:Protein kinase domain-containing protein n=1 Tax=Rubroshorea leprosula TaxID=152421 RepID=A0AAV5JPJ5_9ROSI|nr:hypothetical protein SLEP1_g27154 [Rubroshorea leprosula]